ncbi:MAG: hypoxanthine-guanine phosphoribosyltransferase [Pseudomonadota bacterium]|nr:hypoxanthine-guanine phosphoribosyltransferase [Pseudomonadota bacterium]
MTHVSDELAAEARQVMRTADCIHTAEAVDEALAAMAQAVSQDLSQANPVVLCVMTGGLFATAGLLTHLDFPLELDYLHATRYAGNTTGAGLSWHAKPKTAIKGRHVLIVDDILDEGITLAALRDWSTEQGAVSVRTAILCEKRHDRNALGIKADYLGLTVPDRYVFGAGMDYRGYLRNVRGIYALAE